MDSIDFLGLAKAASNVSAGAREGANVIQDVRHSGRADKDLALENLQKDFSCYADGCHYLCFQLGTSHTGLASNDWDDRFWTCVRLILEFWLKRIRQNLENLRRFQKQRKNTWTGWLFSSCRFTRVIEDFGVVNLDTRIEEVQLITALLNFQLELQNIEKTNHRLLSFLGKDLEWKALKIQIDRSRFCHQHNMHPNWGRTIVVIAETAIAAVEQGKSLNKAFKMPDIDCLNSKPEDID